MVENLREVEWRHPNKMGYQLNHAWFHQFIVSGEEPRAIIELENGTVKSVLISEITFVDNHLTHASTIPNHY